MNEALDFRRISLRDTIGCHYDPLFYNLSSDADRREKSEHTRYYIYKGSRNSKKSYSVAYWIIINMMMPQYSKANTLVVRKFSINLKNSCYALLEKCMISLGVRHLWKCTHSPLEMTYIPTGQKIVFQGLDDPYKVTSLDATYGKFCWCWIEEAYQIDVKEHFDIIDQSFRGIMPKGLFIRIMLTLNPWNKTHWIRTAFFETEDGKPLHDAEIFAETTNYTMNEWISDRDRDFFERMKALDPKMYEVAGLGHWGSPEGMIYTKWFEEEFDWLEISQRKDVISICGLDFGFSADPTALVCALVNPKTYDLWIYDEMYERGLTSPARADYIKKMGHAKSEIVYDSANPLDATELGDNGIVNLIPAPKTKETILNGINRMREYTIHVLPKCVNFITEISNYMWYVDKDGRQQPKPSPACPDHLLDSCRYLLMGIALLGMGGYLGDISEAPLEELYPYEVPLKAEAPKEQTVHLPIDENDPDLQPEEEEDDDAEYGCWST